MQGISPLTPPAEVETIDVNTYTPMEIDLSVPGHSTGPLLLPPSLHPSPIIKVEVEGNAGGPPLHSWGRMTPSLYPPTHIPQSSPTHDHNHYNAASLAPSSYGPPAIQYASRPSPIPEAPNTPYQHPSFTQQVWNGCYPPGLPPNNYYSPGSWNGYSGAFTGPPHCYQPQLYGNAPPPGNYGASPTWHNAPPNYPVAPGTPSTHIIPAAHGIAPTNATPPTHSVPPTHSAPPGHSVPPPQGAPFV
ncbi:hypothetical protein C0991_008892 [Blastosporella zonata]|nr:hypothetical protein C0991_008892 [Blastosporella zonata]